MTRLFLAAIMGAAALPALQACAGNNAYMGILLTTGRADPELQLLANQARAGNKEAQLELGIRFSEGRGVERDINKARQMYSLAASDNGEAMWIYSPPVGNGTKGRLIPVEAGSPKTGLQEAKLRLEALHE